MLYFAGCAVLAVLVALGLGEVAAHYVGRLWRWATGV